MGFSSTNILLPWALVILLYPRLYSAAEPHFMSDIENTTETRRDPFATTNEDDIKIYTRPDDDKKCFTDFEGDRNFFYNITPEELTGLAINDGVKFDPKTRPHLGPIYHSTSNFSELISNSHIFVDKSWFIKCVLVSEDEFLMLSSPRKWGKTINLQMLKAFLEIQVDEMGRAIEPRNETSNYKLFKYGRISETKMLRKPLRIARRDDIFQKFQGQWPVIYMDLFMQPFKDYLDFKKKLQLGLSRAFSDHLYMLNALQHIIDQPYSTDVQIQQAKEAREKFQAFVERRVFGRDMIEGLHFLSKVLHKHFQRKVFLLLDEYDDVVIHAMVESTASDRTKVRDLYLDFLFHSLQRNQSVERSVIHGVTNVIENVPDRFVKDLVPRGFILSPYSQFLGFTEIDMKEIYAHLNIPEHDQILVRAYCNGYAVSSLRLSEIYDPRCVNAYLRNGNFTPDRWERKIGAIETMLPTFMKIASFEESWTSVLTNVEYNIGVEDFEFTYETLCVLANATQQAIDDPWYCNKEDPKATQAIFHYLMINGYFTWIRLRYERAAIQYRVNRVLTLKATNLGVITRGRERTFLYYAQYFNITPKLLNDYAQEMNREFLLFVQSNQTVSERFEIAYEKFVRKLPLDVYNLTHGDPRDTFWTYEKHLPMPPPEAYPNFTYGRTPENHYRASFFCFFLRSLIPYRIYDSSIYRTEDFRPSIVLTLKDKLGVIVEIQYDQRNLFGTQDDFEPKLNFSHSSIFFNAPHFRNVETVKLVSILVHRRNVMVRGLNVNVQRETIAKGFGVKRVSSAASATTSTTTQKTVQLLG